VPVSRRQAVTALGVVAAGGAVTAVSSAGRSTAQPSAAGGHGHHDADHGTNHGTSNGTPHSAHAGFQAGGHVVNPFDPHEMLRDFDWGTTTRLPGGRVLREWHIVAQDATIQVAPGVSFDAWTYNRRVPGPTLRCREGEALRIHFTNGSGHPHTIHFHGIHTAAMDGTPDNGAGLIAPGESTVYEFDAVPFGVHHYHCHVTPLAEHIAKGLYGMFIVDPSPSRPEADELVMVMNAFDTNFDLVNEIYAVNTVGFAYAADPIRVARNELVRIYLLNIVEYDPINSFHIHGNFFHYFPTGTSMQPAEYTDTLMQAQGQRGIVELRFPYPGRYMFHAHKTEFAELGWMGNFEVAE
jgi:manganese oxidase